MSKHGTFGVLIYKEVPLCTTLEPPDKNNKENESCIPEGSYICKRDNTGRYDNTFEVSNVEGRTEIEFHIGNWVHNTEGCILVGIGYDTLSDKPAIMGSRPAMKRFMDLMVGEDEFALIIQDAYLYGTEINKPIVPIMYPSGG